MGKRYALGAVTIAAAMAVSVTACTNNPPTGTTTTRPGVTTTRPTTQTTSPPSGNRLGFWELSGDIAAHCSATRRDTRRGRSNTGSPPGRSACVRRIAEK